ncbi:MAG: hypothetical protein MZU84_04560 [Sphingobacterium sp.]|nr:hypothetical protein [Sphingobacterium sp.]
MRSIRKLDGGRLPILVFSGTIGSARRGPGAGRRSASPATSTSTAPRSTSCRRSRRTCSRTASTGRTSPRVVARDPGRLPLRQHHRRRRDAEPRPGRPGHPHDEPARAVAPAPGSASACPTRSGTSTPMPAWPGATAASAWALQFERIDAADQSAVEAFVDAQHLQHASLRTGIRGRGFGIRCVHREPLPRRTPSPVAPITSPSARFSSSPSRPSSASR